MKCPNHPGVEATWRCTACSRLFCDKCVKTISIHKASASICPVCGERCTELSQTEEAIASEEPSFWDRLPGIFIYPLRRDGPFILAAGAVFFALADFATRWTFLIGLLVWLIVTGYLCRYFLSVIYRSSTGENSPPTWPEVDAGSFFGESLGALFRFVAPAILSYLPALAYFVFVSRSFDTRFVLLVIAGSLYYPIGLTAVAIFDDIQALSPLPLIRSIFRAPVDYVATTILFMILLYLNYLQQRHVAIHIVAVGAVIRWFLSLYIWTVTLHLLGMFYHANRHKLRWV